MTVRDGRIKRTETVSNSTHPEWNEELQFIVDDPDNQSVSVLVKDDDAFNDTVSMCDDALAAIRHHHVQHDTLNISPDQLGLI